MFGENLLYTAMFVEGLYIYLERKDLQAPSDLQVFCLRYAGRYPVRHYCVATTRNSSAAATVACGEVVVQLQLLPDGLVQE